MFASLASAGCSGELSALDPAGPAAARVAELWWIMLGGAVAILSFVLAVALYALRDRHGLRDISPRRVLVGWGLVFPLVTLALLMGLAFLRGEQLFARGSDEAVIAVRAEQWRWVATYPGGGQTINAVHVPAGRDFTLELTSADVIHSFWVPRLGGKMDAVPGKANRMVLHADAPGRYRGVCAEYCGIGHAPMQMVVIAHPAEAYAAALAEEAGSFEAPPQVLHPRPAPAATIIEQWRDYLLDLAGIE